MRYTGVLARLCFVGVRPFLSLCAPPFPALEYQPFCKSRSAMRRMRYDEWVLVRDLISPVALAALDRAEREPASYAVRYLVVPGPRPRALVVLGEAHLKLGRASEIGEDVVRSFDLRGVETFQRDDVAGGRLLGHLINAPRTLLRLASLGVVKGSTITEAKAIPTGHTEELEKSEHVPAELHAASLYLASMFGVTYASFLLRAAGFSVPVLRRLEQMFQLHFLAAVPAYALRDKPWAWRINPLPSILTARDKLLAEGTVRMLREHPEPSAAVVVMGRAHVAGYERELVEKHGFERAER